ncbi:hypothetical protein HPY42_06475 [Coprothermobacteraceae bacterium]|nr:hypothetical protein [Coprothermobacteraceae bacterium]
MARKAQAPGYLLERIDDFSGGWNTAHPASIGKNDLVTAKNVLFTPEGKIVPRWGMAKRFGADFDPNPVLGMGALYKSDGTTRLVMAAGTTLYVDKPHVIFNYDSQADWEQSGVYTNLDTKSSPGDVKLYTPPTPIFSRPFVAYTSTGQQVAFGVPRYEAGQFGQAIMIEEGTTNLLKNASFEVYTGWTGVADGWTSGASAVVTSSFAVDTTNYRPSGTRSQKTAITASTGVGDAVVYQQFTVGAGITLTVSGYLMGSATGTGAARLYINAYNSADTLLSTFINQVPVIPSSWTRVAFTGTTPANTAYVRVAFGARARAAGDTATVYWDDVQVEQKTYPTSIIFANDTTTQPSRFPESLTIPTARVLSAQEGTVESWINLLRSPGTAPQYLFDGAGAANQNLVVYVGTDGKLRVEYGAGTTTVTLVGTTVLAANTWYFVAVRWSSAGVALLINGAVEASDATAPSLSFGVNAYLGSKADGTSQLDGLIDDLRISSRARTDAEIAAAYQSGLPLEWDIDTTYLLHFDGNLNYPADRQGVWVSPVQNAATVQDYASLAVSWSETLPVGTAIACQVRTSADGVTWSMWYDQVNGETATAPANPYSQVRFILQEVGNAGTPILSRAMVSYEGQPSASSLLTGLSVASHYSFAQLQDYLLVFNGIDSPKKYDGTTIADITAGPKAKYCCVYKNRVWAAKGSTLYFSDLLSVDTWPAANFIEVNPSDGDEIIALIPTTMMLLIVKQHSTYYLTGYSPQTFAVSLAGDVGTISPRGALWTPYGIFMLDREGVWQTDLRKRVLLTRKIEGAWKTLNQRALSKGALFVMDERILVAVPSAIANGNDTVLVYDVLHRAWSKVEGWYPSCFLMFWERGRWKYLFGDSRKGQVYEIGGATDDAGTMFEALVETAHLPLMSESWEKRYKWCDLIFAKGSTVQNVAVSFVADGVAGAEKTLNVASGSGTVAGRFWTPPFARTLGVRVRWPATDSSGPELLAAELTYFPRAARPVQVV